ncbi:MAG: MotA/TolQ/ExbB proton channel family protein [Gammaproteobacteria bacterium]
MYKYRLISKFLAINLAGAAFVALAYLNGWCAKVIEADSSHITFAIAGLFVLALVSATHRVMSISRELDRVHADDSEYRHRYRLALRKGGNASRALEIRLLSRIGHIRTIGNGLVVLGLIGTVVGFILVAANVDADTAADVGQVGSLVGALLHGMGVAFYTTLVGAAFSLWLSMNYQILHSATANLLAAMLAMADGVEPDSLA